MNEERSTHRAMPDTVTISTHLGLKDCPGVIIGRGLAVVELPLADEDGNIGYCLTRVPSGCRAFDKLGNFFSPSLAVRCGRELVRIARFEVETIHPDDAYDLDGVQEIAIRYDYLDDLWQERRER